MGQVIIKIGGIFGFGGYTIKGDCDNPGEARKKGNALKKAVQDIDPRLKVSREYKEKIE